MLYQQALQEFSTLCQEKDADNIKTILVFWPRIYNRASIVSILFI